jgi:hypothetical protein
MNRQNRIDGRPQRPIISFDCKIGQLLLHTGIKHQSIQKAPNWKERAWKSRYPFHAPKRRGNEKCLHGEKFIEIAVTKFDFERNFMTVCTTIDIQVALGKDKTKPFKVHSCTPMTVYRLYDGAVQVAVMDILKEPDVLAYINS